MRNLFFIILCSLALFLVSGCVSSQNFYFLEDRVAVLEMDNARRNTNERAKSKEIDNLEKSGRSYREGYADLKSLIEELKQENRLLVGRLEEIEHNSQQVGQQKSAQDGVDLARLDAAVSKNYQRIVFLEQYMGLEPSDSQSPKVKGEEEVSTEVKGEEQVPAEAKGEEQVQTDSSEAGLYKSSKSLLDQQNYEGSRKGFEEFLKLYPESNNADNARFWIADSYYREKWYEKAILEYQKVIEDYSKGNKVSAALLKQGLAFSNLGEKANARLILNELIKKYPGTNEAKIATEKLKTLK